MAEKSLRKQEQNSRGDTSLAALIKLAVKEWGDDDAATWSAALACYAILALAPMAVLALKALTLFTSTPTAQQRIQSITSQWMGGASGQAVSEIVSKASAPGHGRMASLISLVLAIVGAGGVLAELQQAMNRVWKVKAVAGNAAMAFVRARAMSLLVFAVSAVVLIASVVITSWIEKLTGSIGLSWKYLAWGVDAVASLLVATVIFALIYRTLPDVNIEWRATWLGAGVSAALFLLGKYGLALYFRFGSPTSAFGAVGSLAAVLIWVYYSCLIIFFGAEFTQDFVKLRGFAVSPSRHARWLSECDETETATPSSYPPGEKPMRPDTDVRPQLNVRPSAPVKRNVKKPAARPLPTVSSPADGMRPAMLISAGAAVFAAGAAVVKVLADRKAKRPESLDREPIRRIQHEFDRLANEVHALAGS